MHAGWQQPRDEPRAVRYDAEGVIKPSATLGADASRAANAGRIIDVLASKATTHEPSSSTVSLFANMVTKIWYQKSMKVYGNSL